MTTPALPSAQAVAREFGAILRAYLTPEELAQVIASNAEETDPRICHSHDFCDANDAMSAALQCFGLTEDGIADGENEQITALWSTAWNLAKAANFQPG